MPDRIQLIRNAVERLRAQPLETRTEQPLPFESEERKKKRIDARQNIQTNQVTHIGKNGIRIMYRTYGHFENLNRMVETLGMTSIQGEHSYRCD